MLAAVELPEGRERLRSLVERMLADRIPTETLLDDLSGIRGLVSQDVEDKILDVMDLLVGWCAPSARLLPPDDDSDG